MNEIDLKFKSNLAFNFDGKVQRRTFLKKEFLRNEFIIKKAESAKFQVDFNEILTILMK